MPKWMAHQKYREPDDPWDRGGCYAIYGDGRVIYIGSSQRIAARVSAYFVGSTLVWDGKWWRTPWGAFRTLGVRMRPDRFYGEYGSLELRLIRRLMPCGNKRGTKPARMFTPTPLPLNLRIDRSSFRGCTNAPPREQ